ncbi:exonuclease domain-containing protein [Streptomyces sp. TS71-3]|uniref:exonuclease domain-containing protein n=1 Tax=Streptomyces sp. TS71-3 TaxID=2733862 RepID=UPI001B254B55|nr:exonuclease domain-containing protein [Streptomyces sp. TS71-3]GHJ41027.1 3'-5' exonuclease [Streptomyces sp. TS71-3]
MAWHTELLIGFDLETTGTDPARARIVTGAVIEIGDGRPLGRKEWLADPGVPIPPEATAVHGISDARAATGRPADEVADAMASVLCDAWRTGTPVVAYNATFDLTLLAAELRRHGLPSLRDRLDGADPSPVIDPYTIDRTVDRYRRGKRTLEAVCAEYGVPLEGAHDAAADALAAARLACAIAARHPKVAALPAAELHRRQIRWSAHRAADFQAYLRRQGDATAVTDGRWPLRELADPAA